MRVAHLADLHLGYRAYNRMTPNGVNQREADVAIAFRDATHRVIDLAPELVVVAGDVFHASRPPNNAIVHAQRMLVRLRKELPRTVVVLVAGNHDAPRTSDTGDILALFDSIGVHVASSRAKRILVPDLELAVLAVPDVVGVRPLVVPDPAFRRNVLVMHGEVEHVAADWNPSGWDYIALGHYHVYRRVADRAYYSGSIDYTSSNPWGELVEEQAAGLTAKGFVLADLEARTETFHPLPVARHFVELPAIDAANLTPGEIDEQLAAAVDAVPGGIDGKVVRVVIRDIDRVVQGSLDVKALRTYRARALNFVPTFRRPEPVATVAAAGEAEPRRRMKPLGEMVKEAFARRVAAAPDLDGDALTRMGLGYLDQAAAIEQEKNQSPTEPVEPGVAA